VAQNDVKIKISASDQTRGAFSSAQAGLRSMADGVDRLRSNLASSFGSVASIASSIGAGLSIKGIATMADEFASLQARLKLASRDTVEFTAANADLTRIAQAAQTPLSETATLYTRIAASVKDLDVSQRAIAGTTEAVALALRISGASAAESSSAMLQFSQAIASGVLRGEEFNAITEAAPRLLQAVAASLKVPVGSLREMATQGKLTRDVLINGLLKELPALQKEASTLPKTIGAAFTDMKNQLLLAVGEFDKATGASTTLAEAIKAIGTTGIEALAITGANVAFVFKTIGSDIGGIAAALSRIAVGDFSGAGNIFKTMGEDARAARKDLDAFELKILGIGRKAREQAEAGGDASPIAQIAADTSLYGKDIQAALKKAFSTSPLDTFLDTFKDRRKKIVAEYKGLRADLAGGTSADATTLDVSAALTRGRAALEQGDEAGAQAAAAKAKELFAAVSQKEGTASFEKSYFASQLESFELSIVDSAEKAAATAQKVFTEKLAALNQDSKNLTVNVDADGLVAQVKYAVEQVKKDLAANPLRIPVVAVPTITSDGRQSVDLSREALKYGNRR